MYNHVDRVHRYRKSLPIISKDPRSDFSLPCHFRYGNLFLQIVDCRFSYSEKFTGKILFKGYAWNRE